MSNVTVKKKAGESISNLKIGTVYTPVGTKALPSSGSAKRVVDEGKAYIYTLAHMGGRMINLEGGTYLKPDGYHWREVKSVEITIEY